MACVLKGSHSVFTGPVAYTPRSSANGMNHTCLCLPSRCWSSFTYPTPEGWKAEMALVAGYIPK